MSEAWYKDPKTGELYQDRKEKGKTVRYYRDQPQESSTTRAEGSSRRRDQPSHRSRRDSVLSDGTKSASKYQTQGGTSSKRDTSARPDDGRRRVERSETTYISDNRHYGRQDDTPAVSGDRQTHSSYREGREGERTYHQPGGYNPQTAYPATSVRDPADELAGGTQSLSLGADYTHTSSPPTPAGYANPTSYETLDSTAADYGQTLPTQPPLPSKEAVSNSRNVRGTPHLGDSEKLDKSYQIRKHDYKKFFRIGRVFATLWTEGVGQNFFDKDQTFISEVIYRERVHSKIRRFVVVREGDRSVTCLPVTSYEGDGHRKRGIRLEDHGFIHSKHPPRRVDDMLPKSLKVVLSRGAAHIKDPSLVNYGKVYTVEANVKVKDIGDLDDDSKALLVRYFRRVFGGESDEPSGVDDTPRQKSAVLAHVGGAAYDLPSPSGYITAPLPPGYSPLSLYSPSTGQDVASGYPPNMYATQNPSGYGTVPDTRSTRFESAPYQSTSAGTGYTASSYMQMPRASGDPSYSSQPGTGYSAASMGSGYPSTTGYGSAATVGAGYNTAPSYYSSTTYSSSDPRYSNVPTASASQYTAISYTPRTSVPYSSEHATPADAYHQPSGGHATSGGSDYYPGYQASNDPQAAYYGPVIDDRDDNIRLPTLEEEQERRRRESNAGTSRERDRRHRR